MRFGTLSVLVITLALLPFASAQDPPQTSPSATLTIEGLPAEVAGVETNATITVPFTVEYEADGAFACPPGGANVPITVAVTQGGAAAFITAALDVTEGAITIAQGPHPQGASGSLAVTLTVSVSEITANASVPLTVTATAGGAACVPAVPAPANAEATTFANATFIPPPEVTPEPPAESPGFGVVVAVGAVAVVATMMRRRRA